MSARAQFPRYLEAYDSAFSIGADSAVALAIRPPWNLPKKLNDALSHLLLAKYFNQLELFDSAQAHLALLAVHESSPPDWDAWFEYQDQKATAAIGRGSYDEALACHQQQLRQSDLHDFGPARLAKTYRMLGRAHYYLREFEASAQDFRTAIYILDTAKIQNFDLVISMQNLGALYIEFGKLDSADLMLQRSLFVRMGIGRMDDGSVLMAYRLLATLYGRMKQWARAESMYLRALEGTESMSNSTLKVSVRIHYAELLRKMGKHHEGLEMALIAQRLAEDLDNPDVELSVLAHLASHYEQLGRFEEASAMSRKALDVKERLYSKQIADRTSALEAGFQKERLESSNLLLLNERKLLNAQNERDAFALTVLWVLVAGLLVIVALVAGLFWSRSRSIRAEAALQSHRERVAALLEGEERERNRVGKELHDSIGALLSAARMHLSILEGEVPAEQGEPLSKAMGLLQESVREVRAISHALMPDVLMRQGLFWACKDLGDKISQKGGVKLEVKTVGEDAGIPQGLGVMVYRVIQELIQNSLKHGKATSIQMAFTRDGDGLRLNYRDNGVGFNPESEEGKGMGLANIQERVSLAAGKMKLESKPGSGVSVGIELSMNKWMQQQKS